MDTITGDSIIETLCEEFERAKSHTEASLIARRVNHLNLILDFTNEQWGCLLHYQQLSMARLQ